MKQQSEMTKAVASEIGQLAELAASIAVEGAIKYLEAKQLSADPVALKACISSWVRIKYSEAIQDAKSAFDCHMDQVGLVSFKLSMMQAGIEAAKECGMPDAAYVERNAKATIA